VYLPRFQASPALARGKKRLPDLDKHEHLAGSPSLPARHPHGDGETAGRARRPASRCINAPRSTSVSPSPPPAEAEAEAAQSPAAASHSSNDALYPDRLSRRPRLRSGGECDHQPRLPPPPPPRDGPPSFSPPPPPPPPPPPSCPLTRETVGIELHASCNATNVAQLTAALEDTKQLAQTARQYLHERGRSDAVFRKYFGANATTAPVVGLFDNIAHAAKPGVLLRCDDIDGNCARNQSWAGHWRGSNATAETVICDTSYIKRQRLAQVCSQGYTVAGSRTNVYWASDMLHRCVLPGCCPPSPPLTPPAPPDSLFHVPNTSEDAIHHTADGYANSLELATHGDGEAAHNSDSLIYFALEVYALRVAVPGVGCLGDVAPAAPSSSAHAAPSPTAAVPPPPVTTTEPAGGCHTHADGVVHC